MPPALLTIRDAATALGVPAKSLERVARAHGYLIMVGRAKRLRESDLEEIVEKCRCQPVEPACSSESARDGRRSTSSSTPDSQSAQRAQTIAQRLKGCSPNTSRARPAAVVQLTQAR